MVLFGVTVVPPREWPELRANVNDHEEVLCNPRTAFFTVQPYVWDAVVAKKMRDIRAGRFVRVSGVYRNGRRWVFDGHHTLAAYRILGEDFFPCTFYGPGSERISAPKLQPFRRRAA